MKLYGWMGFLGQAGLSLSFARKVAADVPDVGQAVTQLPHSLQKSVSTAI